jgi:4,5:9,10-diseco-3-hydroxy-5,9,17-trioxoandrosta-1(10),2-diene-4-oate hydrolase
VHYFEGGEGPPIVLVHGLGSSAGLEFRFNLEPLAQRHRVIAPDLPGFGQSDKPQIPYTMPFFVETLGTFLERVGVARAAVLGISFGGRVALGHALRQAERVEKLILVDSLGLGTPRRVMAYRLLLMRGIGELMMTSTATALRRLSPATVRRFWGWYLNRPQSVEHILSDIRIQDHGRMMNAPGYQAAYLATLRSLAARSSLRDGVALDRELRELSMPVLLVWGRHDHLFPPSHAQVAAAVLPNARVEIFEEAGHTPQMEEPERFNRLVLDFLAEGATPTVPSP